MRRFTAGRGLLHCQLLRLSASDLDRLKNLIEAEVTQSGHPGRRRG